MNQKKLTQKIVEYRAANPKVAQALDTYRKTKMMRMHGSIAGHYKTTTSTKISNVFSSR